MNAVRFDFLLAVKVGIISRKVYINQLAGSVLRGQDRDNFFCHGEGFCYNSLINVLMSVFEICAATRAMAILKAS